MSNERIDGLIHLYEDGAFNRRELVRRLTRYTGTAAAALAVIESAGLANAQQAGCLTSIQVPESDRSVISQMLTLYGEGGPLFAYQSLPATFASGPLPAVLVIHENRGLTDHIMDVNRRVAKAGYVALAVDLLSRQGGSTQFTDPERAVEAYNRTTAEQRRQDMLSALYTIRDQSYVQRNKLGAVGFCAGGGNVWDLAVNTDQLAASVVFYGPPPPVEQIPNLSAPVLGIYAELDRALTGRMAAVLTALNDARKPYAFHVYQNANHAFNNDTGARYDPAAACDAWAHTLEFFALHLKSAG